MVNNELSVDDVKEKASELSFPESVYDMLQGNLGLPPGGFPEPLRSDILGDREKVEGRPGASLPSIDLAQRQRELAADLNFPRCSKKDAISHALYPKVTEDFIKFRKKYRAWEKNLKTKKQ